MLKITFQVNTKTLPNNQPTNPSLKYWFLEMPLLDLSSSWKNGSPLESLLSRNFTVRCKKDWKCHSSQADSELSAQKAIMYLVFINQAKPLIKMLFQCPEYYMRQAILERCKQSVTPIKFPLSLSTSFEVNLVRKISLLINI